MGSLLFDVGARRIAVPLDEAVQLTLRLTRADVRDVGGDPGGASESLAAAIQRRDQWQSTVVPTRDQAVALVAALDRWLAEAGVIDARLLELRTELGRHFRL